MLFRSLELTLRKVPEPVREAEENRNQSNAIASFGWDPEQVIQVLALNTSERNNIFHNCDYVICRFSLY
jgi:hypothetical protein